MAEVLRTASEDIGLINCDKIPPSSTCVISAHQRYGPTLLLFNSIRKHGAVLQAWACLTLVNV